jgi:hypothetical protein
MQNDLDDLTIVATGGLHGAFEPPSPVNIVLLEHDPEKWTPVFRKRSCSNKKIEWDDDSKKSHPALGGGLQPLKISAVLDFAAPRLKTRLAADLS